MTDNDFNTIPAVESLQNIPSLTPTQRREQRKRRPARQSPHPPQAGEQPSDDAVEEGKQAADQNDGHSIDYRA